MYHRFSFDSFRNIYLDLISNFVVVVLDLKLMAESVDRRPCENMLLKWVAQCVLEITIVIILFVFLYLNFHLCNTTPTSITRTVAFEHRFLSYGSIFREIWRADRGHVNDGGLVALFWIPHLYTYSSSRRQTRPYIITPRSFFCLLFSFLRNQQIIPKNQFSCFLLVPHRVDLISKKW